MVLISSVGLVLAFILNLLAAYNFFSAPAIFPGTIAGVIWFALTWLFILYWLRFARSSSGAVTRSALLGLLTVVIWILAMTARVVAEGLSDDDARLLDFISWMAGTSIMVEASVRGLLKQSAR